MRGLGRERGHWFEFPQLLERALGAAAVSVDLPGTGERRHDIRPRCIEAIAGELRELLRAQGTELPWGVIGISLGGMVALSLAEQWPAGISHAVLINSSSRLSFGHDRLLPGAWLALLRCVLTVDAEARERQIYSLTTNASATEIARWARQAAELSRRAPVRGRALALQLLAAAAFHPPARITQPALILCGGRDRLVAPSCSAALARRLGASHRCHPSAGHDLPLEDPGWVIEQVRGWLVGAASLTPR